MSDERIVKRFISFDRRAPNNARIVTQVWDIHNNRSGEKLGEISWYSPWRQYCFMPEDWAELVFNNTCLREITEQLDRLNAEQKARLVVPA